MNEVPAYRRRSIAAYDQALADSVSRGTHQRATGSERRSTQEEARYAARWSNFASVGELLFPAIPVGMATAWTDRLLQLNSEGGFVIGQVAGGIGFGCACLAKTEEETEGRDNSFSHMAPTTKTTIVEATAIAKRKETIGSSLESKDAVAKRNVNKKKLLCGDEVNIVWGVLADTLPRKSSIAGRMRSALAK